MRGELAVASALIFGLLSGSQAATKAGDATDHFTQKYLWLLTFFVDKFLNQN